MNELDALGRRAAAQANQEAQTVADTEQALTDLRAGVRTTDVRTTPPAGARRTWLTVAASLLLVGGLGTTALVALRNPDSSSSPPQPDVSAPRPAPTLAPSPETTLAAGPDTTPPTTATPGRFTGELRHGLKIDNLPSSPVQVIHQELPGFGERATYVATMRFSDDRLLLAAVGPRPNRGDVVVGEVNGVQGLVGDSFVAFATGRGDWLSLGTRSGAPPESSVAAVFTSDELLVLAETLFYDPSLDTRTTLPSYDPTAVPAVCADGVSVAGGAERDMVLFTCDGTLAVYDGATGERNELIQQLDDSRGPLPDEGPGPAYVDGLSVSPDGDSIWFSTGPEPVVGNLYRYRVSSGETPEPIGFGSQPVVSPDGTQVAIVTLDGISILSTETLAQERGWFFDGLLYPRDLAWSPAASEIAFEANGTIGVLDVATGNVELHANEDPAVLYTSPVYAGRGLEAWAHVGPSGGAELAVIGGQGNQLTLEAGGPDGLTAPIRTVRTPDGSAGTLLQSDVLGPAEGVPWATGVRWAALLP